MTKHRANDAKSRTRGKKFGGKSGINGGEGGNGNNSNKVNDEHHNMSTPCCNLGRDVAAEIFPDTVLVGQTDVMDGDSSAAPGPNDVNNSGDKKNQPLANNNKGEKGSSMRRKRDIQSSQQEQHQQPLLGKIIFQHLLEEHRKRKAPAGAGDFSSTTPGNVSGAGGGISDSAKKKKKKSKKKKKQTQQNLQTSSSGHAVNSTAPDVVPAEDGKATESRQGLLKSVDVTDTSVGASTTSPQMEKPLPQDAPPPQTANYSLAGRQLPSTTEPRHDSMIAAGTTITDTKQSSPSPNKTVPSVGVVDRYLERMLQMEQQQQQPSSNDKFSSASSVSPSVTTLKNRDLHSFVSFLKDRYNEYHSMTQQKKKQKQQQSGNNSSAGGAGGSGKKKRPGSCAGGGGGNNVHQSNNNNNSSSSTNFKCKTSLRTSDVLPTISLAEVTKECEAVCCRMCRTSALAYLRSCVIGAGAGGTNGNTLANGGSHGGGSAAVPYGDCHDDTNPRGGGGGNEATNNDDAIKCFVVDSSSVATTTTASTSLALSNHQDQRKGSKTLLAVPVTDSHGSDDPSDIDRAFDYVAMEEGCMVENSTANTNTPSGTDGNEVNNDHKKNDLKEFQLVLHPILDANGRKEALQIQPHVTDEVGSELFPLDVNGIESMIQYLLLPCTLHMTDDAESVDAKAFLLSQFTTQELISKRGEIEKSISYFTESIKEMDELKHRIDALFDAISSIQYQNNFGPRMSTTLQDCDTACDEYMDKFIHLLLRLTKISSRASSVEESNNSNNNNDYGCSKDIVSGLWAVYDMGLSRMIDPALLHRGRVKQIANRPGCVPQSYLNATHRSSFRTMLNEKKTVIGTMQQSLKKILQKKGKGGVTPVELLCTMDAYFSFSRDDESTHSELDDMCEKLVQARNMLPRTILCGKIEDLTEVEATRCEAVRKLFTECTGLIDSEKSKIAIHSSSEFNTEWDKLRLRYDALLQDQDHILDRASNSSCASQEISGDQCESVSMASQCRKMRMLLDSSSVTLARWRLLRNIQNHELVSGDPEMSRLRGMSQQVRKMLQTEEGTNGKERTGNQNGSSCEGGGGKRRVVCILTSLLYRWLSERCKEWHADLTQRELLNAMEDDALSFDGITTPQKTDAVSRGRKICKKKKDRKKTAIAKTGQFRAGNSSASQVEIEQSSSASSDDEQSIRGESSSMREKGNERDEGRTSASKKAENDIISDEQVLSSEVHNTFISVKRKDGAANNFGENINETEIEDGFGLAESENKLDGKPVTNIATQGDSSTSDSFGDALVHGRTVNSNPETSPGDSEPALYYSLNDSTGEAPTVTESTGSDQCTTLNTEESSAPVHEECTDMVSRPYCINVGVEDGMTFQSAEMYLMNRLIALTDRGKQDSCGGTKPVDVLYL